MFFGLPTFSQSISQDDHSTKNIPTRLFLKPGVPDRDPPTQGEDSGQCFKKTPNTDHTFKIPTHFLYKYPVWQTRRGDRTLRGHFPSGAGRPRRTPGGVERGAERAKMFALPAVWERGASGRLVCALDGPHLPSREGGCVA